MKHRPNDMACEHRTDAVWLPLRAYHVVYRSSNGAEWRARAAHGDACLEGAFGCADKVAAGVIL